MELIDQIECVQLLVHSLQGALGSVAHHGHQSLKVEVLHHCPHRLIRTQLTAGHLGNKLPGSFVLQDLDKTLTDNDVERVMSKLLSTFQNEFGATLR